MKLTDWFDPSVKPVREGLYQREVFSNRFYSRWDGARWFIGHHHKTAAAAETQESWYPEAPWRGLVEDPNGGVK